MLINDVLDDILNSKIEVVYAGNSKHPLAFTSRNEFLIYVTIPNESFEILHMGMNRIIYYNAYDFKQRNFILDHSSDIYLLPMSKSDFFNMSLVKDTNMLYDDLERLHPAYEKLRSYYE